MFLKRTTSSFWNLFKSESSQPILPTLGPFGLLPCDIQLNIITHQNVPVQYRTLFAGKYRYGVISPKCPLDALSFPKTPPDATSLVWAHQVLGIENLASQTVASSPEEKFILFGGFIFLDDFDSVVGVFSVDDVGTDIFFEGPFVFQDAVMIKKIEDANRFQPVTIPDLFNKQIERYCWILPGETQSDGDVISKCGAFLYYHKTTNSYFFFCVDTSQKFDNEQDIAVWEWFYKNEYLAYDSYTQKLLEEAYLNKKLNLTLKHGPFQNGPYVVDFPKLTQTNTKTQFERKLRRLPNKATQPYASWECLVEKKWMPYPRDISYTLEKEFCLALSSGPPSITFQQIDPNKKPHDIDYKKPYELDFNKMRQINKITGHDRQVRRKVDAKWNFVDTEVPKVVLNEKRLEEKKNLLSPSITGYGVVPKEKCQPCNGIVNITIEGATNIFGTSMTTDPFIVITTDFTSFTWRSTRKSSTNPIWGETCCFQVCRDTQEGNINFTFYDYHHFKKDMYLGRLAVSLFDIVSNRNLRENRKLDYQRIPVTDLQPAAQLAFTITYTPEASEVRPPLSLGTILDNVPPALEERAEVATHWVPPKPLPSSPDRDRPTIDEWLTRTMKRPLRTVSMSPHMLPSDRVTTEQQTPVTKVSTPPSSFNEKSTGQLVSQAMKSGALFRRLPTDLRRREIIRFIDPDILEGRFGKYHLLDEIGNGGYAVVRKAENRETNEFVAAKIIQKKGNLDDEKIKIIIQEIQIMHIIADDCCMSLVDSRETEDFIYIVMPYCCWDLFEAIHYDNFTESIAKRAIVHVIWGLQYLHKIGICHRDIKPGNILYHSDTNQWKIADYGISALFTEDNPKIKGSIGTLHYMAPEMLTQIEYTKAVDLWATGVTCYYALSKKYPFDGDTNDLVKQEIIGERVKFGKEFKDVNTEVQDFIFRLLNKEVEGRMTIEEATCHTWIVY